MDAAGGERVKAGPGLGAVAAVAAGNALEFYDFLIYGFFAAQIGRAFFPSSDPRLSLLASLAAFAAGALMRPLGALTLGRLADRIGRKPAMTLSFALMGLAMAGMAFTPPRNVIGVAGPVLAISWRLLQGFALGADVGPSTAFLAEAAPEKRRGLYIALQFAGQYAAVFLSGVLGTILETALPVQARDAWGWRIAFLLGAAAIPLAVAVRRRLIETLDVGAAPALPGPRRSPWPLVLGFLMLAGGTTVVYVLNSLTFFATGALHLSATMGFIATASFGLTGVICAPLGGWLSDRLGRRSVMLPPAALLVVAAAPIYGLMVRLHSAPALLAGTIVLSICATTAFSVILCALTEWLPKSRRSGGLGLVYALAISVFGGSTPFVITWLSGLTHSPLVPAWYMTGGIAVCTAAMIWFPETAPGRVRRA